MTEIARSHAVGPAMAHVRAKPIGLLRRLALVLERDPDVVGVAFEPVTFAWTDGFDGRTRRYLPQLLVRRRDGSRTFVSTSRRTALREDPSLDGRRGHIEAECLSIGATFEVWTEKEIASALGDGRIVLPTWGTSRSHYLASIGLPAVREVPGIVRSVADRAGLRSLVPTPAGWVGYCTLTGIPMVVLPGTLHVSPDGKVTWTPPLKRTRTPSRSPMAALAAHRVALAAEVTA